jgi:hypothetical protein
MRIILAGLVLLAAAALGAAGCAKKPRPFPNKPMGFRGISWGAPVESAPGLTYASREGPAWVFHRSGEKLDIQDGKIDEVRYYFYNDRFYKAVVFFKGLVNYQAVKKEMLTRYGVGDVNANVWRYEWTWADHDMKIKMYYSGFMQEGRVEYVYLPIADELLAEKLEMTRQGRGRL